MERVVDINWFRNDTTQHKDRVQIRMFYAFLLSSFQLLDIDGRTLTHQLIKPMTFPDHITVLHKLHTLPTDNTDHFILDVLILSELHQRPAARCIEDIVIYDYKKAKKAPLKPFMAEAFQNTFKEQEEAKRKNGDRVRGILERVRDLEVKSWDREGAEEKFGV
jgi:hypothetical protein